MITTYANRLNDHVLYPIFKTFTLCNSLYNFYLKLRITFIQNFVLFQIFCDQHITYICNC